MSDKVVTSTTGETASSESVVIPTFYFSVPRMARILSFAKHSVSATKVDGELFRI
jgi:hypothetical protein